MNSGQKNSIFAEIENRRLNDFRKNLLRRGIVLSLFTLCIAYVAPLGATELVAPDPSASSASDEASSPDPFDASSETSTTVTETSTEVTETSTVVSTSQDNEINSEESCVDSSGGESSTVEVSECFSSPEPEADPEPQAAAPVYVEPEPYAIDPQPIIRIDAPAKLMVDPRAKFRMVPSIQVTGSSNVLVCINGNGSSLDIGARGIAEGTQYESLVQEVSGDLSSYVRIFASDSSWISSIVGGIEGFQIYSSQGLSGRVITISAVAVSRKTTNSELCSKAQASTLVRFVALGLSLSTRKADLNLRKP